MANLNAFNIEQEYTSIYTRVHKKHKTIDVIGIKLHNYSICFILICSLG